MSELVELLGGHTPITRIAEHLDGLDPQQRVEALAGLSRSDQRRLFARAADSPPLGLGFFVPDGATGEVRHRGTNTLPLPRRLRQFEKRFARQQGGLERLFGYNHYALQRLLGPGYFVAESCREDPDWGGRGGVVVDYFRVPDGAVPDGWPRVVPNTKGLQRFFYGGTRDFMRRVSGDVSIGAAFRGEKPLDHYFTLCRQEVAA